MVPNTRRASTWAKKGDKLNLEYRLQIATRLDPAAAQQMLDRGGRVSRFQIEVLGLPQEGLSFSSGFSAQSRTSKTPLLAPGRLILGVADFRTASPTQTAPAAMMRTPSIRSPFSRSPRNAAPSQSGRTPRWFRATPTTSAHRFA